MNFPKHSQLVLVLYVHAAIAVTLKKDFDGVSLYVHPLAIAFLYFADLGGGMVVTSHGLWFSWLQSLSDGHQSFVFSVATVFLAVGGVVVAAQVSSRSSKVPEKETVLGAGLLGVLLMGWQAHLVDITFFELHMRTLGFYFLVWMLETAARKTDKMDPNSRRIISIVFSFSILALPRSLATLFSLGAITFTCIHIKGITDDSEECTQA